MRSDAETRPTDKIYSFFSLIRSRGRRYLYLLCFCGVKVRKGAWNLVLAIWTERFLV